MKLLKTNEARVWFCEHIYTLCSAAILILAFGATVIVYRSAWLSEDSFITLRYVNNAVNGYGAVFNVGERVQGYTHPLWYLILLLGTSFLKNEILTAIALSLILTFLTLSILGRVLLKHAIIPLASLVVFILAISIFISSDIWVSFQTGGLENSLSHLLILLIIYESYFLKATRPSILLLWISLLCLTRPDYVIFCVPFGILILPKLRSTRAIGQSFVAVTPVLLWFFFAWQYYGSPLPNTGMAKLGIFPTIGQAIFYGIFYFGDWCIKDLPASLITILTLIHCAVVSRKDNFIRIILVAITLHACWVIFIGGDFMRGSFFMSVLTASVIIGGFEILIRLNNKPTATLGIPLLLSICFLAGAVWLSQKNVLNKDTEWNGFVVNERRYYPGYALKNYLSTKSLENPYLDLQFANDLRIYADLCSPITVHYRNPGTLGYLAGPKVTIIDTLGLTDKYIANLPRTFLIQPVPRPGHPDKYIPVSYLAKRGDIALLPDWDAGIKTRDCSLSSQIEPLIQSTQYWDNQGIINELPP